MDIRLMKWYNFRMDLEKDDSRIDEHRGREVHGKWRRRPMAAHRT
jgi:hypothetical protein